MRALIFAAGRGERMRPLTETTPKPLLVAGGKPLIVRHIEALVRAGMRDIVINTAHLAAQFPATLGDGARWGARLRYSHEGDEPLETGGGMLHALPLLGEEPFIALNGDIACDFDLARLPVPRGLAHLVLVDNPAHHTRGDFVLHGDGRVSDRGGDAATFTFAGIGSYRPALLSAWRTVFAHHEGARAAPPRFPLAPLLRAAMGRDAVSGEHHRGSWTDVGTPQRLAELDRALGSA